VDVDGNILKELSEIGHDDDSEQSECMLEPLKNVDDTMIKFIGRISNNFKLTYSEAMKLAELNIEDNDIFNKNKD
jgi:hypothetical protein